MYLPPNKGVESSVGDGEVRAVGQPTGDMVDAMYMTYFTITVFTGAWRPQASVTTPSRRGEMKLPLF